MSQILYKSFTKQSILEPRGPHGSGGRSAKSFPNPLNPLQTLYKTEHSGASGASWLRRPIRQIVSKYFKSFTNPLQNGALWSLGRLMAQEAGSAKSFPNASNPLQILHKAGHFGVSGVSWLRKPDRPSLSQMLQILYKSFTKQSILEPRAPHGSGGRPAKSFPNTLNPLQTLYQTEHSGASGASWLWMPICQIMFKGMKYCTNSLQNGALWSVRH